MSNKDLINLKQYLRVFDVLGDLVSIQDKDYKILYQNEVLTELVGQHINEYCYKAYEKKQCICEGCPVEMTFKDGGRHKAERKAPVGDGHMHVQITSSPFRDSEGNIIAVIETVRDITARKHAEVELERIFELSPDMLCVANRKGYFERLNKAWEKVTGYTIEELMNVPFMEFVHPDDHEATKREFNKLLAGAETLYFENRYRCKNGTHKILAWNANPVEEGYIYAAARDITELKNKDKQKDDLVSEISQSEERFRTLFENATDLIQITRPDGQFLDVNSSWCNTLGYSLEEALNLTVFDIIDSEGANHCAANFKRALTEGGTGIIETTFKKKDGGKVILKGSANCNYINGQPSYVHCIFHDVTEQRNLEEQLRQSQKMEAIGTMAGGIAHDFNNILTIIAGNAEMGLEDTSTDDSVRENIEEIIKASKRAKDLVNQILAFSRKEKKELIPIRPQALIKETLKLLRSTTPTTVSIVQSISPDCGKILADPTGLHQLTMNLFTNAVHAMDEKGEVSVKLKEVDLESDSFKKLPHIVPFPVEKPGKYARLSVTDEGVGIDKETLKRIFDPFYTTKEMGKGTGMGLSVVHGIVESHSGFITVESTPDQGSTFSVYIPITEDKEDVLLENEITEVPLAGTERILIIDDEEILLELTKRMLKTQGYTVTSECDSIKALEIFRAKPDQFDLVITDQSMPNMSGTEIIAEVLKIRPGLPIILCTGFSSKISEANAREKGISKYLKKPFDKKTLAEAVRKALNGKI